jgi:hypothetical protein
MDIDSFDDVGAYPDLKAWCARHPSASRHLLFSFNLRSTFHRASVHSALMQRLSSLALEIEHQIALCQRKLKEFVECRPPKVRSFAYDDSRKILFLRKHTFILRKVHKHASCLLTLHYGARLDRLRECQSIMRLLDSHILPASVICAVLPDLYQPPSPRDQRLVYLNAAASRMRREADTFSKARWDSDFAGFIGDILAQCHCDTEANYVHPVDLEVSLSRYLFNPHSEWRRPIDNFLMGMVPGMADKFVSQLLALCIEMFRNEVAAPAQHSILSVIFFRTIFNRCYELHSDYFSQKPDLGVLQKLKALGELEILHFPLPWRLLPEFDRAVGIAEFFHNDPFFSAAAQFLSGALFESNPIDALYYVHKCLTSIRKAAMIHGTSSAAVGPQGMATLLCFDDLFSLFFGIFLASELVDVFFIESLVNQFAPKASLSPSFEYAQANLEALVLHCESVTVDGVRVQNHLDRADRAAGPV